ncbi:circularly permuted type 2 ATP-grasp protein [Oscillatoria sp. CS-180]|uniref:circularly permuted type 2 ATP-grasp protein n=1 Tax=Oscillatoria sp. CS-180 TaxID=3021720 RepID=UPI00233139AA|nr:circularly permuted type 2 ATP-grasp protein [Oscillatoria sp. CS-180]MDB9525097.1 circularly permuted type 2 ATP-grasp protein [Oscillatoria sp. CS-180]
MNFDTYVPESKFDEYFVSPGQPRAEAKPILEWFQQQTSYNLPDIKAAAEDVLRELGATFSFEGEERVLPFDPLPRLISATEWQTLNSGLQQRVTALNQFCADVYGDQKILQDGVIPREVIESAVRFRKDCIGMKPPGDIWCHISGIDLVRNGDGKWCVLEDNLRVPSGIAYVLKNRQAMEHVIPDMIKTFRPSPVNDYAQQLKQVLDNVAPSANENQALITPGPCSSAYSEHAELAEQMGIALVTPQDLVLQDDYLHYQSDRGLHRIDVAYRRGDTEMFEAFNAGDPYPDGVAAIVDLCQKGRLALANTIGAGIGDDKVVYAYVPDIIRYYLSADPILPNVETYLCWREQDRAYVLDHLDELVVKAASAEGGEGMLVGINSTAEERADFAEKIRQNPRGYMAQPTIFLSQIPTVIDGSMQGRHTDLRPYVLHQGDRIHVHPGGLTRVALEKGQLVVNSSQGGGAKDTWVLA